MAGPSNIRVETPALDSAEQNQRVAGELRSLSRTVEVIANLLESQRIKYGLEAQPVVRRYGGTIDTLSLPVPDALEVLPSRELDILCLISLGYTDRQIGQELFSQENTVKHHVKKILERLEVPNRAAASRIAGEAGLLQWASLVEGENSRHGKIMAGTKKVLEKDVAE